MVGEFSLALAIGAPVFSFSNLELKAIQATDAKDEYQFNTYFTFRIYTVCFALSIILVICMFIPNTEGSIVIILVATAKALESLSDICYGYFQKLENMRFVAISLMLRGLLSLIALGGGYALTKSIIGACAFLALAWGTVFAMYDLSTVRVLLRRNLGHVSLIAPVKWPIFRSLFILALPMGFVVMLNSLNLNLPKYLIVKYAGKASLGFYSAIASLLIAGSTAVNAVGQSATPRLAKYYWQGNLQNFASLLIKVLSISLCIGLVSITVSILLGKDILALCFTEEYSKHVSLLIWIMVAATIIYFSSTIGCSITAARSFLSQSIVTAFTTIAILIFGLIFIPKYGIIGGAYCLIGGYFVKILGQGAQLVYILRK